MKTTGVKTLIRGTRKFISDHSPEILTGIGIAGMITTTILAVRETPKALRIIDEATYDKGEALTAMETVKACWKCYIPAVTTGAASVACIIGASSVHSRRNTALATAYKLSETAFSEYKEKVIESIGEKKEKAIKEKIEEARIEKNPVSKSEVIITNTGNTLCYEYFSGRYFYSDIDKIKKAVNEINRRMTYDNYVSLSEFYDELDLDHTQVSDEMGWNLDDGLIEVTFGSHISDDGRPCIVVNYAKAPRYDFSRYM